MEDIVFYNFEIDLSYCDMFFCFLVFKVYEQDMIFVGEFLNFRKSLQVYLKC